MTAPQGHTIEQDESNEVMKEEWNQQHTSNS